MPRPYRSNDHLRDVIATEVGAITVQPLRADDLHFDIAWSNSQPANSPVGQHGSRVLDIGRGVSIRAIGNVGLVGAIDGVPVDNVWKVKPSAFNASQYPSGRELTPAQDKRARELIAAMLTHWAVHHAGDIAQADDIDRNNAARTLEEYIERHEDALTILRRNLAACDEGEPFSRYPDLPTDR
jgi:hypothetical protein